MVAHDGRQLNIMSGIRRDAATLEKDYRNKQSNTSAVGAALGPMTIRRAMRDALSPEAVEESGAG
jgi:hypothetical protein